MAEVVDRFRQGMDELVQKGEVRLMRRRNGKGLNPGRKSSKVIQDCTICVSCRWTVMRYIGCRLRDYRHEVAGSDGLKRDSSWETKLGIRKSTGPFQQSAKVTRFWALTRVGEA